MDMELDLRISKEPSAPGAARHVIDGIADRLSDDVVDRFRLVVSELVTNSIRHTPDSDRSIRVHAHVDASVMRVDVIDDGTGFDLLQTRQRPPPEADSGWGLFLVDQLTDRWGVQTGRGRGVWCEFDLDVA